jgi:hypothetical protein
MVNLKMGAIMKKGVFVLGIFVLVLFTCSLFSCASKPKYYESPYPHEELPTIDTNTWTAPKTYIGALLDYIIIVVTYDAQKKEGFYYNFNSENAPYVEPFTVKDGIATSLNKRYYHVTTYNFSEGYRQLRFNNLILFELGTDSPDRIITGTLNVNKPIMDAALEKAIELLENSRSTSP